MAAMLQLKRETSFAFELRRGRFDISVDGASVGTIDHDETVEVPVEPGSHTLRLQAGRYSSRELTFEAADGATVSFRCHGATIWPTYVASIARPELAISLRQA